MKLINKTHYFLSPIKLYLILWLLICVQPCFAIFNITSATDALSDAEGFINEILLGHQFDKTANYTALDPDAVSQLVSERHLFGTPEKITFGKFGYQVSNTEQLVILVGAGTERLRKGNIYVMVMSKKEDKYELVNLGIERELEGVYKREVAGYRNFMIDKIYHGSKPKSLRKREQLLLDTYSLGYLNENDKNQLLQVKLRYYPGEALWVIFVSYITDYRIGKDNTKIDAEANALFDNALNKLVESNFTRSELTNAKLKYMYLRAYESDDWTKAGTPYYGTKIPLY
tara:strand:- start:145 stop:1002 length:858 start_codon:yes stop_codon:yes gene_type:complete